MAEDEDEGAITFETFRKFQRKEKKNEKLQELPEDFFKKCVDWINRKQKEFEEGGDSALLRELENVKSIVSDIFERRRKKILILALHSVRSKKVSKNLLPEEKEFFEKTVKNLRDLEANLLERVLEGERPEGETGSKKEGTEKGEEKPVEEVGVEEEEEEEEKGAGSPEANPEDEEEVRTRDLGDGKEEDGEKKKIEVGSREGQKLVRIVEEVDRFMGTDEEEYGPLDKGDLVTLPEDVAELLIEKGKAEVSEI